MLVSFDRVSEQLEEVLQEIRNDRKTATVAIAPMSFSFLRTFLPSNPLMIEPINGRMGMSHS